MRVLLVNKFAHVTGGADRHCLELAALLRDRGHEVAFVSTASDENLEREGVFVRPSVTARTRDALPLRARAAVAGKAFWNVEAASATRRLIERFRPDVAHVHKLYPQLSAAPVLVAARMGVPVVQTLHDYELISANWTDVRGGWLDRAETRGSFRLLNSATFPVKRRVHARLVTAFVSVSRFVARVHDSHGIPSTVIPNFVRPPTSARADRPPPVERTGIIYFGRLAAEKGVLDVVEMARLLADVPVTIVGSGPLEREIRARCADLENVVILGFRRPDEIWELVRGARLAVVPSRWQEPGTLVPLEAMALGTPVVAYANGGLAEYVADSGGGRVVPSDAEALAHACAEILSDEGSWEALSRRALHGIADRHSPDTYVERLEHVYSRVVPA